MKKLIFLLMTYCAGITILSAQTDEKARAAFSKSYEHEYGKDYPRALDALTSLNAPDMYEINLRLGWLYYLNGDFIKSMAHYKKAIALVPASIEARFGYTYPLAAVNNWNDVINCYQEVLKMDPKNTVANYRLANIYFNRKAFPDALKLVKILVSAYPFEYDYNFLAGKIYLSMGKIVEAKTHFQKALLYNPLSQEAKEAIKNL